MYVRLQYILVIALKIGAFLIATNYTGQKLITILRSKYKLKNLDLPAHLISWYILRSSDGALLIHLSDFLSNIVKILLLQQPKQFGAPDLPGKKLYAVETR